MFLKANGAPNAKMSRFFIGGRNSDFVKGYDNTVLLGIGRTQDAVEYLANIMVPAIGIAIGIHNDNKNIENVTKIVSSEQGKSDLKKFIEDNTDEKVSKIKIASGRLGVTNIEITFDLDKDK